MTVAAKNKWWIYIGNRKINTYLTLSNTILVINRNELFKKTKRYER